MLKKFKCWFFGHKWTSAAVKDQKPTDIQLKSWEGFKDYATMYCDRCGYVSKLNSRLK